MAVFICSVCGFVYDEEKGIPEAGIAPGTAWENLPDDWECPLCGAAKSDFEKQAAPGSAPEGKPTPVPEADPGAAELSPLEMSALCTNLARGCEKQYKSEEAALYNELADYFRSLAPPAESPDYDLLSEWIEQDIASRFPAANSLAAEARDRGALRALVWSEKVTRILKSLLARYRKAGDALLENSGVYVCTICGFVYLGDSVPDICPVCKVPNWKIEKVEAR